MGRSPLPSSFANMQLGNRSPKRFRRYNISACGSDPIAINLPDVWWVLGDRGDTATPGGWLRVFGRSIARAVEGVGAGLVATNEGRFRSRLTEAARRGDRQLLQELLREAPEGVGATRAVLSGPSLPSAVSIVATLDAMLTPYSATFALPASIRPGVYTLHVANDVARDVLAPFSSFLNETVPVWTTITVAASAATSPPVFPIDVSLLNRGCFNATSNILPPSTWRCATSALQAALKLAGQSSGGGTVQFPRGQFYITGTVLVPTGVTISGAGRELTAVYFEQHQTPQWIPRPSTTPPTAPNANALLSCGGLGAGTGTVWGLRDITFYATAWYPDLIYVSAGQRFTMERVRVLANAFFAQNPPQYHPEPNCSNAFVVRPTRGRDANYSQSDVGAVIRSHGRNVFVRDCDLYGTGDVITSSPMIVRGPPDASAIGMQWGLFEGNTIRNGGACHFMPQWEQVAFVNNTCAGTSLTAMGQALGTSAAGASTHVFEGQNRISDVWGNDREILTYDDAGGAFWGWATVSGTSVRLHAEPLSTGPLQRRVLAMILNGTGAHEYRRVVVPGGDGSNDNRTWTLDRPFSAAVGSGVTVFLQIMPARVKNLHVLNHYVDGGAIQIYGHGSDIVIGHNLAERTTGFWAWGQWRGWGTAAERKGTLGTRFEMQRLGGSFGVGMNPTTHVQFLANVVAEGNNIVNVWYTNKTQGDGNPGPWAHGTGIADFMDQNCFGVVDGRVGFLTPSDNPPNQYTNAFTVFRDNVAESNGGVWITGAARDVLVEGTQLRNSDHGIMVDKTCKDVLVV